MTFIAILELLRESVIEVVQAEAYAPLHIRAASSVRLVADDGETVADEFPEADDAERPDTRTEQE